MTKRIEKVTGQCVSVDVLRDASGRIYCEERNFLDTVQTTGHVREVVLKVGEKALLVARTVYVSRWLRTSMKLRTLGTRPLGELLFSHGDALWSKREFSRLTPRLPIFRLVESAMLCQTRSSWARRTLFLLDGCPILVTEVFLPALLDAERESKIRCPTSAGFVIPFPLALTTSSNNNCNQIVRDKR